ncbi:MAG: hypothetical protein PVI90_19190 [Desulfobacteraceae bacterium]|jgi:hypothetical protein
MTDQNPLESNGDVAKTVTETENFENDKIKDEAQDEGYQFIVEGEELMDDVERKYLQEAAKKYEPLIDKLFDEPE